MLLGNIYLGQQKFADAQAAYESLVKAEADNPAGYFRLGYLYRVRKQYDQALKYFDRALAINPNLMDAFSNVVMVHGAQKQFDQALERCDRQLKLVADTPAAAAIVYNLMGSVQTATGNINAAEEAFKAAVGKNPDYMQPYYSLAGLYLREKKEDKALDQFKALLEVNPKQPIPHVMIGIISDAQKKFDVSEKHYRAALEINPKLAPAANNLAYILADTDKNLNEALMLAQTARERMPEDPNVMDTLGWVYFKKGLYDSAIREFRDSLTKSPDSAPVVYHLGMALYRKGEKDKAKIELERALRMDGAFSGADEARKVLAEIK